jgi:hypothetical protein
VNAKAAMRTRHLDRRWSLHIHSIAAMGANISSKTAAEPGGPGAVVETVNDDTEFALPAAICVGLNAHVAAAGVPEQLKLTLLGKAPVLGLTATV